MSPVMCTDHRDDLGSFPRGQDSFYYSYKMLMYISALASVQLWKKENSSSLLKQVCQLYYVKIAQDDG